MTSFVSILKNLLKGQRKWIFKLPSLERLNDKNVDQITMNIFLKLVYSFLNSFLFVENLVKHLKDRFLNNNKKKKVIIIKYYCWLLFSNL